MDAQTDLNLRCTYMPTCSLCCIHAQLYEVKQSRTKEKGLDHARIKRGQLVWNPLENRKAIGFLVNPGPDALFLWYLDYSLPSPSKKSNKKTLSECQS